MDVHYNYMSATQPQSVEEEEEEEEECMEVKRGPWTIEEDLALMNYITKHGEGRWNSLTRGAGLRRTGKSCRLRWLNYLRPDVRRGNITLEEQLKIIELHSRWGNRWSKIAQHLPGRTDNEIKNYWRTRVQKQAKQLRCDVNSKLFKDTMRHVWIPRLVEKILAEASTPLPQAPTITHHADNGSDFATSHMTHVSSSSASTSNDESSAGMQVNSGFNTQNSSMDASSDQYSRLQLDTSSHGNNNFATQNDQGNFGGCLISPFGYFNHGFQFQGMEQSNNVWSSSEELWGNLWNVEDFW